MVKKTKKAFQRPPVITVMGHIDHGKTTLLDALRSSKVQENESGGITQHIGAYQITYKNQPLTFIDTPGHAAFAAMRSRGAKTTDLVILVIDAGESVKPQTKECLTHIKASKVPFLVAINKMDLPNATPDIVKKDLADAGVSVEGFGGDIVCVPISAKTKKGLDELQDMIVLISKMQKITADPDGLLEAVVIESSLDQKRGPLVTVIVKNGTLKIRDKLKAGNTLGKVKALFDAQNKPLKKVSPGEPAQILGFNSVPEAGSVLSASDKVVGSEPPAVRNEVKDSSKPSTKSGKALNVILKADVTGTLEAITQNLTDEITLISSSVGDITESDILLAQSTKATIIAFRVKTTKSAAKLADIEGILIKSYSLIHELLDDLQKQVLKILEPTIDEKALGEAKIMQKFTVKGSPVAGCQITSGKFTVGDKVHLLRKKEQLADAKIKSIYKGKEKVDKTKKGDECGLGFSTDLDFNSKDTLQAFTQSS